MNGNDEYIDVDLTVPPGPYDEKWMRKPIATLTVSYESPETITDFLDARRRVPGADTVVAVQSLVVINPKADPPIAASNVELLRDVRFKSLDLTHVNLSGGWPCFPSGQGNVVAASPGITTLAVTDCVDIDRLLSGVVVKTGLVHFTLKDSGSVAGPAWAAVLSAARCLAPDAKVLHVDLRSAEDRDPVHGEDYTRKDYGLPSSVLELKRNVHRPIPFESHIDVSLNCFNWLAPESTQNPIHLQCHKNLFDLLVFLELSSQLSSLDIKFSSRRISLDSLIARGRRFSRVEYLTLSRTALVGNTQAEHHELDEEDVDFIYRVLCHVFTHTKRLTLEGWIDTRIRHPEQRGASDTLLRKIKEHSGLITTWVEMECVMPEGGRKDIVTYSRDNPPSEFCCRLVETFKL
ncbi:hypothetical protein RQP46_010459 [Phenoliferia psychrophenolica]